MNRESRPADGRVRRRWGIGQWGRLRQRIRTLWRWVVVRTVRNVMHRFGARLDRGTPDLPLGEIRQFPGSR